MAHIEQQEFCQKVKSLFPEYFKGVRVCDIGSLNVNGDNHYLFDDYEYIGVDIGRGKNVNVVARGHEYKPIYGQGYDTVISTECFEHDKFWKETMLNIIDNLLVSNGLFIFTCATTGRPEHGTKRSMPLLSPLTSTCQDWEDYYMNLTEQDVKNAIDLDSRFKIYRFYTNEISQDLYFWGVKI